MKRLFFILSLAVFWPGSPSLAQLAPPNEMGITMSAIYLNVRDLDADKKFFTELGGMTIEIDGTEVMKFPGVFIFLTPGTPPTPGPQRTQVFCACPSDGLETSVINHIGFNVQHYDEIYSKFKAMGTRLEDFHGRKDQTILFGPDGLMLEITASKMLTTPVGEMHVHTFVNDMPPPDHDHQVVPFEMFLWYHKMFGAKLTVGGPGSGFGDSLPGARLRISQTRVPVGPTKGHVIDHIGFEVENLEAFCKQLPENGVPLTEPYSRTRHASYASAVLMDPWGTTIELTEGLNKF